MWRDRQEHLDCHNHEHLEASAHRPHQAKNISRVLGGLFESQPASTAFRDVSPSVFGTRRGRENMLTRRMVSADENGHVSLQLRWGQPFRVLRGVGRALVECICIFLILSILHHADGWIMLSNKGYTVKHRLLAQAGVKVPNQVEVNGFTIAKPVTKLQCNPSRRGGIRWDDKQLEGCDGTQDWRPLTFCSRSCKINTDSVPCGLPVNNKCGKSCNQNGTGLNMRQCILQVLDTPCQTVVRDLCGNACGLEGQMNCESQQRDLGEMVIKALKRKGTEPETASFSLSMREMPTNESSFDSGLFWTFKRANATNATNSEDMVVFQKLVDTSVPAELVRPRGPGDHQPKREKPFGTTLGMEISKPPSDEEATLRVSMYTELTGGYIRVGEDYNSKKKEKATFIFLDSTIEKQCPFLMNAANYDGNLFTKVCLEPATDQAREIVLPDASGVIISNSSGADLRTLPGLRSLDGQGVFKFTGKNVDKSHIIPPDKPRVNCSNFQCNSKSNFTHSPGLFGRSRNASLSTCNALNYSSPAFDLYRLFYGLFAPDFSKSEAKFWPSLWPAETLNLYAEKPETTFIDLARAFVALQLTEAGIDTTNLNVTAQLMQFYGLGPVTDEERCFVCCCNAIPKFANRNPRVCPLPRDRPKFCLKGQSVARQCISDVDCAPNNAAGMCGYDPEIVTCLEWDQGWICWDVYSRNKSAIRLDFVNPQKYRDLNTPAVSGKFITSGNLHEVTSLGYQVDPIVGWSSHTTTTTIQFQRTTTIPHLRQQRDHLLNNTLLVPNNVNDAILLTTGNLEDITLESTAMTGLGVEKDVFVRRFLKFGDNSSRSGFLLNPSTPSAIYTTPHSGRPSSHARPGQLSFQISDSMTVLEFEPAENGKVSNINIPATSGTILTTGNLESVTAESGRMSSLGIDLLSYLQGGIVVGAKLNVESKLGTQFTLQGHAAHAMTFESMHSKVFLKSAADSSTTRVRFELKGEKASNIFFPGASGTVITTGNMPDINTYTGNSTVVDREAHLRGPVYVGARAEDTSFRNPLVLAGYVTGQIIHHEAKLLPAAAYTARLGLEKLTRLYQRYSAPFTWNMETFSTCITNTLTPQNTIMAIGQMETRPIFLKQRFRVDPFFVDVISGTLDQCRLKCESKPGCGVMFALRSWNVNMLSVKDYSPISDSTNSKKNYISNAIRQPKKESLLEAGIEYVYVGKDECYPGFNPVINPPPDNTVTVKGFAVGGGGFESRRPSFNAQAQDLIEYDQYTQGKVIMNFSKYPLIETFWTQRSDCQGVIAAKEADWTGQYGNAWKGFIGIDLEPVACGTVVCQDPEICQFQFETSQCTVIIRSRVNGFFLTGWGNVSNCMDQQQPGIRPCARWTNVTTIWTSIPFKLYSTHSRYLDWNSLKTDTLFRFRRKGVCLDMDATVPGFSEQSVTMTCNEDKVQNISVLWGDVGGTCGGFSNNSACETLQTMNFLRTSMFMPECLGDGCTIMLERIQASIGSRMRLTVTSLRPSSSSKTFVSSTCTSKRLAIEFSCRDQLYLGRAKSILRKPHFEMWTDGQTDDTLFHLHSTPKLPSEYSEEEQKVAGINPTSTDHRKLWRDCWLTKAPAHECDLQNNTELEVHMFMRHDSTTLAFSNPSDVRTITFPDGSGTVISTGNLKDLQNLRSLNWRDSFVYSHKPWTSGHFFQGLRANTYLDFAAIGSGSMNREVGVLPKGFSPATGANQRIVFPDTSGTIITTGNVDDLLFKSLNLTGMRIDGDITFKSPNPGGLSNVRFEDSSRLAGCLNFVEGGEGGGRDLTRRPGERAKTHYSQLCFAPPTKVNSIKLPDVSGRILASAVGGEGNLLNLPKMRFEASELAVAQDMAMEGELFFGREGMHTDMKVYSWVDGDVGMTFSSPKNSLSVEGDTLTLHSPHLGGVDIALRSFLTEGANALPVSVRNPELYGPDKFFENPISGTSPINQTMCYDLLTQHNVHGMHGLGYFVHSRQLVRQTILSGTPYWGVEVPGNQTFPACVHVTSGTIVCEGGAAANMVFNGTEQQTVTRLMKMGFQRELVEKALQAAFMDPVRAEKYLRSSIPYIPNCTCMGRGEQMMVQWRRIGKQVILGSRPHCPDKEASTITQDCPYTEAPCDSSILEDAGCAFDGNVLTHYRSTIPSVFVPTPFVPLQSWVERLEEFGDNAFMDMSKVGRCILGLRFNASVGVGVSMVRVYPVSPKMMVGGMLQGSSDPQGQVWVDLYEFKHEPTPGVWTDVLLPQWRDSLFVFVRFLGPACPNKIGLDPSNTDSEICTCNVAEWEWHQGLITQRLSATDRGTRSYYINEDALSRDPAGSMVLKCASRGWFPSNLQLDVHEVLLPEASGTLLTTGNLEDVTKLAGTMTSVKVSGDAHIRGSTVLGTRGEETEIQWNSLLTGRFPLAMGGGGNYDAASFLTMPDPTVDNVISFPTGSVGGRLLTTGMIPILQDHMSVVGDAAVRGPSELLDNVIIGDHTHPSVLMVHSSISSAFPLQFKDAATPDSKRLVFGMEEPLGDRVLMLPDLTGTVITTGNLPDVIEGTTLVGDTVFENDVKFIKGDVRFGGSDNKINLTINSAIGGQIPLKFGGRQADQHTLSFSVEEPSGQNVISLPDVTGTVITTGNFPDTVDDLRVLGNMDFFGKVSMLGRKISIGHDELKTKLTVNSIISGRFPLTFGHVSDANVVNESLASTTTFEIAPPSGDNVISFPDTSGTVITTGNVPTTVMVPKEYALELNTFSAISSSVALGQGAKEGSPKGSFTFTDASQPEVPQQHSTFEVKENSFNVAASGGVKFITGYTASNRELGVLLESKSSAWSILSDEDSKIKVSLVDDLDMLDKLKSIPISTWRYQGQDVTHMGPMAQDMHTVFGVGEAADRISTLDADGAIFSALRGCKSLKQQLSQSVEELHEEMLRNDRLIQAQGERIAITEERIASMLRSIEILESKL